MRTIAVSALVVSISLFSSSLYAGKRPPKTQPIVSPQGYSQFTYHSRISNNFEDSKRFDFDSPVSLRVRVHRLRIPEHGYAELLYTLVDEPMRRPADLPANAPVAEYRRATLQTVEELGKLQISEGDLRPGVIAELTGWPALPGKGAFSEMLVDEIRIQGRGKHVALQKPSDKMLRFKDKADTTVDPPLSELDPKSSGG